MTKDQGNADGQNPNSPGRVEYKNIERRTSNTEHRMKDNSHCGNAAHNAVRMAEFRQAIERQSNGAENIS
jgi:hypothetical protein